MLRKIMVVDFETCGNDPNMCEPVQLSAVIIDPIKMQIVENSEFDIIIKPEDIDNPNFLELNEDSINWHSKVRNKSPQEIIEMWKTGINVRLAIESFVQYINKWNPKKNASFTACNWGGANYIFDQTIFKRYCDKFKINYKNLFWWRDSICCLHLSWLWLQWQADCPNNFQMDTLRDYFGMSIGDSHNSLQDVYDEAKLIIRFLQFFKKISEKTTFKNVFAENNNKNEKD